MALFLPYFQSSFCTPIEGLCDLSPLFFCPQLRGSPCHPPRAPSNSNLSVASSWTRAHISFPDFPFPPNVNDFTKTLGRLLRVPLTTEEFVVDSDFLSLEAFTVLLLPPTLSTSPRTRSRSRHLWGHNSSDKAQRLLLAHVYSAIPDGKLPVAVWVLPYSPFYASPSLRCRWADPPLSASHGSDPPKIR